MNGSMRFREIRAANDFLSRSRPFSGSKQTSVSKTSLNVVAGITRRTSAWDCPSRR
jgi:hypothetical protein